MIYKVGDDLRKDSLVVQMITIMDKYWKESGLDLSLTHYNIVSTGPACGLIEVVSNAVTIFKIQMVSFNSLSHLLIFTK